jgi:hypothetical protein
MILKSINYYVLLDQSPYNVLTTARRGIENESKGRPWAGKLDGV